MAVSALCAGGLRAAPPRAQQARPHVHSPAGRQKAPRQLPRSRAWGPRAHRAARQRAAAWPAPRAVHTRAIPSRLREGGGAPAPAPPPRPQSAPRRPGRSGCAARTPHQQRPGAPGRRAAARPRRPGPARSPPRRPPPPRPAAARALVRARARCAPARRRRQRASGGAASGGGAQAPRTAPSRGARLRAGTQRSSRRAGRACARRWCSGRARQAAASAASARTAASASEPGPAAAAAAARSASRPAGADASGPAWRLAAAACSAGPARLVAGGGRVWDWPPACAIQPLQARHYAQAQPRRACVRRACPPPCSQAACRWQLRRQALQSMQRTPGHAWGSRPLLGARAGAGAWDSSASLSPLTPPAGPTAARCLCLHPCCRAGQGPGARLRFKCGRCLAAGGCQQQSAGSVLLHSRCSGLCARCGAHWRITGAQLHSQVIRLLVGVCAGGAVVPLSSQKTEEQARALGGPGRSVQAGEAARPRLSPQTVGGGAGACGLQSWVRLLPPGDGPAALPGISALGAVRCAASCKRVGEKRCPGPGGQCLRVCELNRRCSGALLRAGLDGRARAACRHLP